MPNYLVVASSGRAIAQSLKVLGNSVAVVDGFADCDTQAAANEFIKVNRSHSGLSSSETLRAVAELQTRNSFDGLFYDAAIESDPNLLNEIDVKSVFGNSCQTLIACKNPKEFFATLDLQSIPYPDVYFDLVTTTNIKTDKGWLLKTALSSGGLGVTPVPVYHGNGEQCISLSKGQYVQRRVEGFHFSITFLANKEEILALGFNSLWQVELGERMPYAYSGAVNDVKLDESVKQTAHQYASDLSKAFDLVGLNSIDFIFSDNIVYVLEVNPRIPATYELYETKYGELMKEHIEACCRNVLPATTRKSLLRAHGIVYAPCDICVTEDVLWPLWSSDRPHAGEVIQCHEPVCNVFAGGQNSAQVCEMIERRKRSIISKLTN